MYATTRLRISIGSLEQCRRFPFQAISSVNPTVSKMLGALPPLLFLVALVVICVVLAFRKHWALMRRLRQHFSGSTANLAVVSRDFLAFDLPNLQPAIDAYLKQRNADLQTLYVENVNLNNLTTGKLSRPMYRDMDVDVDVQEQFLINGLYLIRSGSVSLAIYVVEDYGQMHGDLAMQSFNLQVMAALKQDAAECINALRKLLREVSIYRGKIISLERATIGHDEAGYASIRFHEVPKVAFNQIILPPDSLQIIERNTIRFFQKSAVLKKAGQSIKRGLLFYGPPGTGKTWTARWLSHTLPNVTVILVAGEKLWNINESCRLARMLSPSMVILEDVDLIAVSREQAYQTTPLHQLMNEMDGLDSDTEVLFLLTTNRPDVLEPALAARPGRVDQGVLFPLPDSDCRRRLVELYTQFLDLRLNDMPHLIKRTEGASPAFIKELVRKAALIATDDHTDDQQKLVVTDGHFEVALKEMTRGDSDLSGRLLGFNELVT